MSIQLRNVGRCRWEIPRTGSMRVPGLIFAGPELIDPIRRDPCLNQVVNVATLPGIVQHSLAMPDIHWGYGFPIGGVAAFDLDEGIISPGGVGYDINCGCRLMTTALQAHEIRPRLQELVLALFREIPVGVGSESAIRLSAREEAGVATEGALWAVKNGLGEKTDLERTEDGGVMKGADPDVLSERAVKRGLNQLGTLGSGNHFIEIQVVDKVFDATTARAFGLREGRVALWIHTGSRGFGHQICDDFLKTMASSAATYGIEVPDRQLACAPLRSELGKRYLSAMACAANYAWANRQILMHRVRETILTTLEIAPSELGMALMYDVCHNIAKIESHPRRRTNGLLVRPSKRRDQGSRSRPFGPSPCIPGNGSACPDSRRHGQILLCPGRGGGCRGAELLIHLPRSGAGHEPEPSRQKGQGTGNPSRIGRQRNLCAIQRQKDPERRNARSV